MTRLRRVDCSSAGVTRVRRGRGFSYVDACHERVTDTQTLDRIAALVIPPAWEDVWICPLANGHIQATGTDAAGRRQYRYHDDWRTARDLAKHERMVSFAKHLSRAREQMGTDLARRTVDRRRVLAAAARLLDLGFFRIGGEEYAETHHTYGLATMLTEHVTISRDGVVTFDFVAKSGQQRVQQIAEPELLRVLTTLKRRRGGGDELLAYKAGGGWHDVRSTDINDYLSEIFHGDFTAKDFRTWHATVLCAVALGVSEQVPATESARKRAVSRAVKETAHYLGNTPAVCRSAYIDPRVIDRYADGLTIAADLGKLGAETPDGQLATHGAIERAVLRLIDSPQARRRPPAA